MKKYLIKTDDAKQSLTLADSRIIIGSNALVKSKNIELCSVKLDPGQVIKCHTHKGDEAIFIIYGKTKMACLAPAGVEHELTANSELWFIAVHSPPNSY